MKITNVDIDQLITDLDAQRKSLNFSYQNVADSCDVSQATIIRIFKHQTEPTLDMIQKIAAAVKYDYKPAPVLLKGYSQDDYITYLQQLLQSREDDFKIREAKAEARHNMIVNQKTRTIRFLSAALVILSVAFAAWLVIDILHPTMGWFQREIHAAAFRELSNICLNIF